MEFLEKVDSATENTSRPTFFSMNSIMNSVYFEKVVKYEKGKISIEDG